MPLTDPSSSPRCAVPRLPPGVTPRPLRPAPERAPLNSWERFCAWLNMLFIDHAIFRFFFNLRQAIAPAVFRSSHPMPYQLRAAARAGVKTVINLRGDEAHIGSNRLEWDTAKRVGLTVLHLPMGSRDAPSREEVFGLVRAFDTVEYPLLIHCKSGADRAGLASALYLLIHEGVPLEKARRELRFWWHGHVRQAKTGILDHFLDVYAAEQARNGIAFLDWVAQRYDRDAVRRSFRAQWWASQLVDRILRRE